jgi:thymidylate kinase
MAWIELLGAPGVGKTTQLELLAEAGIGTLAAQEQSIFSGDPLPTSIEDAIVDYHTSLAQRAATLSKSGLLVSDFSLLSDIAYGMVRFRGAQQAEFLERTQGAIDVISVVPDMRIVLDISDVAVLQERIRKRAESETGRNFELGYTDEYLSDIAAHIIGVASGRPETTILNVDNQSPEVVGKSIAKIIKDL